MEYKVYAQLEPIKHQRFQGVIEFLPNVVLVRTIEAPDSRTAFNLAKIITPHPLVESPFKPNFFKRDERDINVS